MGDRAPMGPHVVGILLRHGVRNVRQGGLPFFFATLMTALGLFALAMFVTVQLNVGRLTDNIGHQVGAVSAKRVLRQATLHPDRVKKAIY